MKQIQLASGLMSCLWDFFFSPDSELMWSQEQQQVMLHY